MSRNIFLEQFKKNSRDINHGDATVCAGGINDEHGRWVHGWHLPGMKFTTSKARAMTVAKELDDEIQRLKAKRAG